MAVHSCFYLSTLGVSCAFSRKHLSTHQILFLSHNRDRGIFKHKEAPSLCISLPSIPKCIQECHCQVQNILHWHALSFLRLFLSLALSQPTEFNMQSNGSRMGRRGKSFSQFPLTRDYQSIKALVFGARESVVRCACSPQPCLTRISVSD